MLLRRRPGGRILKAFLPVTLLLALVVVGAGVWVTRGAVHPPRQAYLVTPERFSQLSDRGLQATNETWVNADGTTARGWLLRGPAGAPAVVLLHAYGADRSWLLNLGVKLNEATNYTVLWPDQRGHGENPLVEWTSFGAHEADDVQAALEHLRSLRTPQGSPLVGEATGLYGVELGAYAALRAATRVAGVRALALDSVPADPDDILRAAVEGRTGLKNSLLQLLARGGVRIYFLGGYENTPACEAAARSTDQRVLLLSGEDAGVLRDSTVAAAKCFPDLTRTEVKSDLPLTGLNLASAPGEQGEAYDRVVIDFFDRTLR